MEDKPISKKDILKELDEIQSKDHKYSDGRILGSMCTEAHPFAKEVYCKFLDSNFNTSSYCFINSSKNFISASINFILLLKYTLISQ